MAKYNCNNRLDTIFEVIKQDNSNYKECSYIPSADKLDLNNGFYVPCSALFVDLRGSSDLTDNHRKYTLAKIYKIFIKETIEILNSNPNLRHIKIVGDCVQGIFNTPSAKAADSILRSALKINTMIDFINKIFEQENLTQQNIGIGISYGKALMVKAGDENDNEIIWMGNVLNKASKLCNCANKYDSDEYAIRVSKGFKNKLTLESQKYIRSSFLSDELGTDLLDGELYTQIKELYPDKTFLQKLGEFIFG